jgi:hypothetical protein
MEDYENKYKNLYGAVCKLFRDMSRGERKKLLEVCPDLQTYEDNATIDEIKRFLIGYNNGYYKAPTESEIDSWLSWLDSQKKPSCPIPSQNVVQSGGAHTEEAELPEMDGDDVSEGLDYAEMILEKTLGKVDGFQSDDGVMEHQMAIDAVKQVKSTRLIFI